MKDFYVSRTNCDAALNSRYDPVVYDNGLYTSALTKEQLDQYENNGFIILPNVFSPDEIHTFVQEIDNLAQRPDLQDKEELVLEPGSNTLRSIFRVHEISDSFADLSKDSRVLDVARQILGSEVYIHQSRANMKQALDGKEFYWHSDFETWHVEDGMPLMRAVSCSVLLTDNTEHNGPLMLIPGSHKKFVSCVGETPKENYKQSLRRQEIGVPDAINLKILAEQGGLQSATAKAGSVIFFDCNTMHCSSGNLSPWPRSNVFMVFNSVKNRLVAPFNGLEPRPDFLADRSQNKELQVLEFA